MFLPLILLDGRLYSYDHKGRLREEGEVQLMTRYYTRRYFESMLINVVRKERFKDFLKSLEEDLERVEEYVVKNIGKLDEQVKLLLRSSANLA